MFKAVRITLVAAAAVLMTAPGALAQMNINVSLGGTLPVVLDLAGQPVHVLVALDQGERRPYVIDRFGRRVFVDVVYDAWGRPMPMVYDVRQMGVPVLRERWVRTHPRTVIVERRVVEVKHPGRGHHKGRDYYQGRDYYRGGDVVEVRAMGPGSKHRGNGKGKHRD